MEPAEIDYKKELTLIVDDDPHLRESLSRLLEIVGIPSDSVSSGKEALSFLESKDYTILLTDMKMPGMGGMELIKKVSKEREINIIAMTGFSEGYTYVDVINAGASDFIKKPFGIEELEAKIRRIITERNLRRELNRLSITDSLTGLYNQRHFYSRLNEEVSRARRQRNPLSLILMDINDFKLYNDTKGHLAGDEALRDAGEIIRNSIREAVDSGYRYGGDEFAIILIDADIDTAREIGLRIESAFEKDGKVGVSLGYTRFLENMTIKDLVAEADRELYKRKSSIKKRDI